MNKPRLIFYSFLLFAIAAVFIFRSEIYVFLGAKFENRLQVVEKAATNVVLNELKKQADISPKLQAPLPLKLTKRIASPESVVGLTIDGVIKWTNIERSQNNGLPPLLENNVLDRIATLRAKDMFDKQYFAHFSPNGEGAESVAKLEGYEYLSIGENLALGDFENDEKVVEAWMNSPGHRANILGAHYAEIGVATQKRFFEGRETWIAVQIFGRPMSACPTPDNNLKVNIESLNAQLISLESNLETRRTEIQNMLRDDPQYNEKINEYNSMINQYNSALTKAKTMAKQYNDGVANFNKCVAN